MRPMRGSSAKTEYPVVSLPSNLQRVFDGHLICISHGRHELWVESNKALIYYFTPSPGVTYNERYKDESTGINQKATAALTWALFLFFCQRSSSDKRVERVVLVGSHGTR